LNLTSYFFGLKSNFDQQESDNSRSSLSSSVIRASPSIDEDSEQSLFSTYCHHVFPLQFPLYSASMPERSWAWIQSLLQQSKPLYYAALGLAAAYQNSTCHMLSDHKDSSQKSYVRDNQQHFYTMAVTELRQHIELLTTKSVREGMRGSIETLACMVYLIMLEVSF
jgi:C6 transcription factor Pro1